MELTPEQAAEHMHGAVEGLPEELRGAFIDSLTQWLFERGHFAEFAALGRRRGWRDEIIYALLVGHARHRGIDPLLPWAAVYVLPCW